MTEQTAVPTLTQEDRQESYAAGVALIAMFQAKLQTNVFHSKPVLGGHTLDFRTRGQLPRHSNIFYRHRVELEARAERSGKKGTYRQVQLFCATNGEGQLFIGTMGCELGSVAASVDLYCFAMPVPSFAVLEAIAREMSARALKFLYAMTDSLNTQSIANLRLYKQIAAEPADLPMNIEF